MLMIVAATMIPFGVFVTFWPRTVQRFAHRGFASKWAWPRIAMLESLLKTEYYVLSLRFVGVLALGIGAIALTLLTRVLGT